MGLSTYIAGKRKIGKGEQKQGQEQFSDNKKQKLDTIKEDDHWWFLNN